jgi:hypothetical protein
VTVLGKDERASDTKWGLDYVRVGEPGSPPPKPQFTRKKK